MAFRGPFQPKSFSSSVIIGRTLYSRKAKRCSVHSFKIINRNGSLTYCSRPVGPQTSWTVRNNQKKLWYPTLIL